jgi:AIPR protein
LNGGIVIVARGAIIDDKEKMMRLKHPSIINSSQTQGELARWFEKLGRHPDFIPSIKYEVIVTDDDGLIAEISIARNFQNDVRAISIAGRRGQLNDLEEAIQMKYPKAKLRKSETDLVADGDFLDTEKIIQVIFALLPEQIVHQIDPDTDASNKVFTYSQKTRCLKLFQKLVEDGPDEAYSCCLDLAPIQSNKIAIESNGIFGENAEPCASLVSPAIFGLPMSSNSLSWLRIVPPRAGMLARARTTPTQGDTGLRQQGRLHACRLVR